MLRDCFACGLVIVDSQRRVATITTQAQRILSLQPPPALPAGLEVLPAPVVGIVSEVLASGRRSTVEVELRPPGSEPVSIRLTAEPLRAGKKSSGVALVLNQVTAVRQFEERLQQLNRLANLGTLAAGMAHEIRNALVAGKTFIDLLLEKNQETELVGVVRRELGRIDTIVSRMLKFAGPPEPFSAVHVHQLLEHSLLLVEPRLQSKAIALDRSFQASTDVIRGEEYQLQQAFLNLLFNAVDAMGSPGKLTVTSALVAAPEPPRLRITIQDTGMGIPPENMERLFEPFFTTKAGGTGLGLAITQRILQQHGGAISVDSQLGQGTTFQVMLPAWSQA